MKTRVFCYTPHQRCSKPLNIKYLNNFDFDGRPCLQTPILNAFIANEDKLEDCLGCWYTVWTRHNCLVSSLVLLHVPVLNYWFHCEQTWSIFLWEHLDTNIPIFMFSLHGPSGGAQIMYTYKLGYFYHGPPWFARYKEIHQYLVIITIKEEVKEFCIRYKKRLITHTKKLDRNLCNQKRQLKLWHILNIK